MVHEAEVLLGALLIRPYGRCSVVNQAILLCDLHPTVLLGNRKVVKMVAKDRAHTKATRGIANHFAKLITQHLYWREEKYLQHQAFFFFNLINDTIKKQIMP